MSEVMVTSILESPEALATILSVLAAILAASIGVYTQRIIHRREYTLGVLNTLLTNPVLTEGRQIFREVTKQGLELDEKSIGYEKFHKAVTALNYIEFMCLAYVRGDLDRRTVAEQLKYSLQEIHRLSAPYIKKRREMAGHDDPYIGLTRAVNHMKKFRS